jgi:hypothetical protein
VILGKRFDDPDARLLRRGWIAFAVWTPLGGQQLWQALRTGEDALVGVALSAPLWAAWLPWLQWRGTAVLRHWFARCAFGRWHGNYFEFDGWQIRIDFDGDEIFVAAADVFDALGIEVRGRECERHRLIAGGDGLKVLPGDNLRAFTERGLQAWMERRTDAVAVRFGKWYERTVVDPRRKRSVRTSSGPDGRRN